MRLFSTISYEVCESGDLEQGFTKIAIFSDSNGIPTHAARQLKTGYWTSKLGPFIDVQHTIHSVEAGEYGNVIVYLKRPDNKRLK